MDCPADYYCTAAKSCSHCRECFVNGDGRNNQCPIKCNSWRPAGTGGVTGIDVTAPECNKHQACAEAM